ncbi:hypothetical protein [Pseudoneobacillus sp. C159]
MAISLEFKQAIKDNDTRLVRIMLKDNLVIDPTFVEFDQMLSMAEEMKDLYDEHDGEVLNYDVTKWSKDYLNEQMVQVVFNFSKERLSLLKSMSRHILKERKAKIEKERTASSQTITISRRQVGTGLAIGGVVTTAVGVAVAKPVIIVAGVAAVVVGGVCIMTDKEGHR